MTNGEAHISLVSRLEAEKESMILQVSVLTDQVEAQGEKIRDLEFTKEEMQIKLEEAEQLLDSVSIQLVSLAQAARLIICNLFFFVFTTQKGVHCARHS